MSSVSVMLPGLVRVDGNLFPPAVRPVSAGRRRAGDR